MNKIKELLQFLNLLDRNKHLSLTNSALVVVLVKIAISPFDWSGAALLLPVIASYIHKRSETNKATKVDSTAVEMSSIKTSMETLTEKVTTFENTFQDVKRQSEEVKRLVSTTNMANAFVPRNKRE